MPGNSLRSSLAAGLLFAGGPAAAFEMPIWQSAHFAGNPLVGSIVAADGTKRSMDDLVKAIGSADLVIAGETHDNPDHHVLQAKILADMLAAGERPAVVFEMVPQSLGPALAAYLARPDATASGLGPALDWEGRGWPAWATYQPIAEAALAARLTLKPGDLSRETIRAIGTKGQAALPPGEAARLGLDQPLDPALKAELTQTLKQSHCGMLPDKALAPMLTVQRARDGALADALMRAAKDEGGGKALLIAGAGHGRTDWAVPASVRAQVPDAKVLSIALFEVEDGKTSPGEYGISAAAPAPYDFLVFTPKADISDPCEGMAEQMQRKKT